MDQVSDLLKLTPVMYQLGRDPCDGVASCTDNACCEVVRHKTGRTITPAMFRAATGHVGQCTGITPAEALRGLAAFGVRTYRFHSGVTPSDVLRATDDGVVIFGVGYGAYPTTAECQVGGKTDFGFRGAHAATAWGRRLKDGRWVVWVRDSDHRWADRAKLPLYDRFDTAYLTRAMRALVTDTPWAATFMLAEG
jgi:hypothetical protein